MNDTIKMLICEIHICMFTKFNDEEFIFLFAVEKKIYFY